MKKNEVEKRFLTIMEAARFSGLSESLLYKLSARRVLPILKIGNKVILKKSLFEQWLLSHSVDKKGRSAK
ncbi:helix-turn-helix domain-containing protein [Desulfobacterota bacterium AH_259_B03_O07]|nr:helix-turn-helix domain-containing protein [Desulfobacterota bacterium AH_259_B03_O07]